MASSTLSIRFFCQQAKLASRRLKEPAAPPCGGLFFPRELKCRWAQSPLERGFLDTVSLSGLPAVFWASIASRKHGDVRGLEVSRGSLFQDQLLNGEIRDRTPQTGVLSLQLLEPLIGVAKSVSDAGCIVNGVLSCAARGRRFYSLGTRSLAMLDRKVRRIAAVFNVQLRIS